MPTLLYLEAHVAQAPGLQGCLEFRYLQFEVPYILISKISQSVWSQTLDWFDTTIRSQAVRWRTMTLSLWQPRARLCRCVSTSLPTNFTRLLFIPFRILEGPIKMAFKSSSLLIHISLLRRNKNVLTSVIYNPLDLTSRYSILSRFRASTMIWLLARMTSEYPRPTHQTRGPLYTIRQESHASPENYASELHHWQVMITHLSRVGRTSCEKTVTHGRVHFFLCMKNWGKKSLFQTIWTEFYRLCSQQTETPDIARVIFLAH